MFLYHATDSENIDSILKHGILAKFEGVYLTDSIESAVRWVGIRFLGTDKEIAVIKVKISKKEVEEGCDHSPLMIKIFGVGKSYLHPKNITTDKIVEITTLKLKEVIKNTNT